MELISPAPTSNLPPPRLPFYHFLGRDPDEVLEHARELGRVIFTQDIRFKALAEAWQQQARPFAGLLFGHQLGGTIGQFVKDLELIAKASDLDEWQNVVDYLPF